MDLGHQLSALACLCNRIVNAVRKPHDLSLYEFHTLLTIKTRHPSCVGALTERMEMEKTRMSKVLRSLEDRGIIQRSSDLNDRRMDHIALTDAGTHLTDLLLHAMDEAGEVILNRMPEQERAAFVHYLELTGDVRTRDIPFFLHTPPTTQNEAHR